MSSLAQYLETLDEYQRAIVRWCPRDGNLCVDAAAGSGKTRSIVGLASRLIVAHEVEPSRLILTTFSNRGAAVMRSRMEELLGKSLLPRIGTFHSVGLKVLRRCQPGRWEMSKCLDTDARTRGLDAPDGHTLWRAAVVFGRMPGTGADSTRAGNYAGEYQALADLWRARGVNDPWAIPKTTKLSENPPKFQKAWQMVNDAKHALSVWDFNDALEQYLHAVRQGQDEADVVVIDESQDNNQIQYAIAQAYRSRIILVGDVFQCLYRYRGAFLELARDAVGVLNAQKLYIPSNYRSRPEIVAAGNALLRKAPVPPDRDAEARRIAVSTGSPIVIRGGFVCDDDEAEYVAGQIETAISQGIAADRHLILCRTNALVGVYQAMLIDRGIPVAVAGAKPFFANKEALAVLCYCILARIDAWNSLERILNVPFRGISKETTMENARRLSSSLGGMIPALKRLGMIGKRPLETLADFLADLRASPWHEVGSKVVALLIADKESKKKDDMAPPDTDRPAIYAAAGKCASRFNDASEFLAFAQRTETAISLRPDDEAPRGRVLISTIHRAKGGEADFVFVPCSEGVLPHWRNGVAKEDVEDERRLLYVAITRAREQCVLLWNRQTHGRKGSSYAGKSRFFDAMLNVPRETLEGMNQ